MTDDNFHVGLKLSLEVDKSYDRIDMFVAGWVREHLFLQRVLT